MRRSGRFGTSDHGGNGRTTCLGRLSGKVPEWEPLALAALMQHRQGQLGTGQLLDLLRDLERCCWCWVLCSKSGDVATSKAAREKRVLQALHELGLGGKPADACLAGQPQSLVPHITSQAAPALRLTRTEAAAMVAALEGPVYDKPLSLKGIILISLLARLNEHIVRSGPSHAYTEPYRISFGSGLSAEHVLPQKPAASSGWDRELSAEEQAYWVHRLGNLVLLHIKLNSKASNLGFRQKKEKWLTHARHPSQQLPLTDAVSRRERWTPAEAAAHQSEMIQAAAACWSLSDVVGE